MKVEKKKIRYEVDRSPFRPGEKEMLERARKKIEAHWRAKQSNEKR